MSVANVQQSASYYAPLLRARIVRALKALRSKHSINELALLMGSREASRTFLRRKDIEAALAPAGKVVKDAVRQGGRIGAEKVNKAL